MCNCQRSVFVALCDLVTYKCTYFLPYLLTTYLLTGLTSTVRQTPVRKHLLMLGPPRIKRPIRTNDVLLIQRVSKNIPDIFSCNSRKHYRIFIIFGTHVTEKVSNQ